MNTQFDVCRNLGSGRATAPYLIVVQSRVFAHTQRRVVVPLMPVAAGLPEIAPRFTILGQKWVANPLLMFTVSRDRLGEVVASLADDASASALIGAIDQILTRAYG